MQSVWFTDPLPDSELPWSKPFRKRCKDVLDEPDEYNARIRCDLKQDHTEAHVAERGMFWVFWYRDSYGH